MTPRRFLWNKNCRIYVPGDSVRWSISHAQSPTPFLLNDQELRIYFAVRDIQGHALTIYFDCDPNYPEHLSYIHSHPILPLGSSGSYDQNGIVPGSCCDRGDHIALYYTGWNTKGSKQYQVTAASALSYDRGQTFVAAQPLIILGKKFFNTLSPWVTRVGQNYKMWFAASDYWAEFNGQVEAIYQIYQATSQDGWTWLVEGGPIFSPLSESESCVRPTVWFDGKIWHMWFGFKSQENPQTRIGYASSIDLERWVRNDSQSVLTLADVGWDSEMHACPAVQPFKKNLLLFYNGNGYGRTGIGYASMTL